MLLGDIVPSVAIIKKTLDDDSMVMRLSQRLSEIIILLLLLLNLSEVHFCL